MIRRFFSYISWMCKSFSSFITTGKITIKPLICSSFTYQKHKKVFEKRRQGDIDSHQLPPISAREQVGSFFISCPYEHLFNEYQYNWVSGKIQSFFDQFIKIPIPTIPGLEWERRLCLPSFETVFIFQ